MSRRDELAHNIAVQVATGGPGVQELVRLYLVGVPGELFSDTGKWKYSVELDYRGGPGGFISASDNALRAFEQACANGTSEVNMRTIPPGWHLFVPAPPEGFPVMVTGGAR